MRFTCCLFLMLPCLGFLAASESDEFLKKARVDRRGALAPIQRFSCTYLIEETIPTKKVFAKGTYLRSGNVVRIKEGKEGSKTEDLLIRNGQAKRVGRSWQGENIQFFATLETEKKWFIWGDVWQRMMLDLTNPEGERESYDSFLERIQKAARVSPEKLQGRDCVKIEVEEKTKEGFTKVMMVWLDAGHHYMVRRIESYDISDPRDRNISEVLEFSEIAPGITFPIKVRVEAIRKGKNTATYETQLADIQVNPTISEKEFRLPQIPPGTHLEDSIHGKSGTIGPDWNFAGPTKARTSAITLPAKSQPPVDLNGRQSLSEPWSTSWYVLAGSLALLLVCILVLFLGKKGNSPRLGAGTGNGE